MSDDVFSFLEFGAIDPSMPNRLTWDFRTGQKAYDWLMVARYLNDVVAYQDIAKLAATGTEDSLSDIFKAEVHHQDDGGINLNKLVAMHCLQRSANNTNPLNFFEFGSTLFGCIDAMGACAELLKRLGLSYDGLDLGSVKWLGVDNSIYLNKVAELIHPNHDISTNLTLPDAVKGSDLFFAKGVSILYQVRSTAELSTMVDCSTMGLFDYSLSYTGERDFYIGSGKQVRYLDVGEVVPMLDNSTTTMMIRRSRTRVEPARERIIFDGVRGPKSLVDAYITEEINVGNKIASKTQDSSFKTMLGVEQKLVEDNWIGLADYCRENKLIMDWY